MKQNKFLQLVFDETDLLNLVMQGRDINDLGGIVVDKTIDSEKIKQAANIDIDFKQEPNDTVTVEDFHRQQQSFWHMPDEYKSFDIAEHVLSLCKDQAELQRCGQELLLFQEKNLFDLLRYLKYLVDLMQQNNVIWGVGRGSSVSSYVLYLLGVHKINSMYYNLDIKEFLR